MSDYDRYINITMLSNDEEEVIDGMLKAGMSVRQINDIFEPINERRVERRMLRDMMTSLSMCKDQECPNSLIPF